MINKINLSLAICEYDHIRDLLTGKIQAEGLDLNFQHFPVAEIFSRFTRLREWDISEMSLGMYVSLLSQGDTSLVAIPVFPSRVFRQSAFFVRRDGDIKQGRDLIGRKIGYPDWSHTAGIYARGFLKDEIGVELKDVEWVQAGINEPGLRPHVKVVMPEGVKHGSRPDSSLDAMLVSGEIDCVLSSHVPKSATGPNAPLVRLFPGGMAEEAEYYKKTGIFPIMHVIALRRDVHEKYPWVARNLCSAFEKAKNASLARMLDATISRYPFPWMFEEAEKARALFGHNFWPYGVEANRSTLTQFLDFAAAQGVAHRPVQLEELFPEGIDSAFGK